MRSRRQFVRLSVASLLAAAAVRMLSSRPAASPMVERAPAPTRAARSGNAWLPGIQRGPIVAAPARAATAAAPTAQMYLPIVRNDLAAGDMPILGPASGAAEQASAWLAPRAAAYTPDEVVTIVDAYARTGAPAGIDWFLALAQMAYETGHLTSWWSQRPRRNPAGIGVTGRSQPGAPEAPPGDAWTWDERDALWREGWSFPSWLNHAIPAQLGRLLAYALTDAQADSVQHNLIALALAYRPLPDSYRGSAPTIYGLNGHWAVPGATYGQSIADLARRMRDAA